MVSNNLCSKKPLVDVKKVWQVEYPSLDEKLYLELATAIHRSRSAHPVVSREAQEEAALYLNNNGFEMALDRLLELERTTAERVEK